ncbi:hypothetical protein FACS1894152_5950 [Bacilli bacterium]|nr:hypothetical protein FACS1894152_5950 [Bacilli bacterium]
MREENDVKKVTDQDYNDGKYSGEWKGDELNGGLHGTGIIIYRDGSKYKGCWVEGKKGGSGGRGQGVYTYMDNDIEYQYRGLPTAKNNLEKANKFI